MATLTIAIMDSPYESGTTTTAMLQGDLASVEHALRSTYENSSFVRLLGTGACPDTKNVTHTNFIDIGWQHDERTGRLLLLSAEDNLGKGAAGQALQVMNSVLGLPETRGFFHEPSYRYASGDN